MFGSRDFPKLISGVNCSEFAMRSAIERANPIEYLYNECNVQKCLLSIAPRIENYCSFTIDFSLKVEK